MGEPLCGWMETAEAICQPDLFEWVTSIPPCLLLSDFSFIVTQECVLHFKLSWCLPEWGKRKRRTFAQISAMVFLQHCPLALLKLHAHCQLFPVLGISDLSGKDSFPRKIWNSKDTAQEQNLSFSVGIIYLYFWLQWTKVVSKVFTLQT